MHFVQQNRIIGKQLKHEHTTVSPELLYTLTHL